MEYHERTIGELLEALGFSHISARPRHPKQDGEAVEAFKKNFPRTLAAHLAGAICPARGVGAALALPFADTCEPTTSPTASSTPTTTS